MVKKVLKKGSPAYICEVCGFGYLEEKTARRCQEWCSAHGSCNLEITRSAVTREKAR